MLRASDISHQAATPASPPSTVIASAAKQSSVPRATLGCFVAALLAMTAHVQKSPFRFLSPSAVPPPPAKPLSYTPRPRHPGAMAPPPLPHSDDLLFTPVESDYRGANGWTSAVQRAFVGKLSPCGVVARSGCARRRTTGSLCRAARTRPARGSPGSRPARRTIVARPPYGIAERA